MAGRPPLSLMCTVSWGDPGRGRGEMWAPRRSQQSPPGAQDRLTVCICEGSLV